MVALVAAFVSIVFKEVLFRYTMRIGKKVESNGVIANAWDHSHRRTLIYWHSFRYWGCYLFRREVEGFRSHSCLSSEYLYHQGLNQLIRPNIDEVMEKSLPKEMEDRILEIVNSFPQVSDPHNLRTRRVGHRITIEIHIRMDCPTVSHRGARHL